MHECDEVLSAFFRGQLLVMLSVFIIYGFGLTLVGLKVGFIIGLIGGLFSIVPYLGSIFVVTSSTLYALVQFGTLSSLLGVWSVYLIGQTLESWVLTPYFVGHRIGLHPVVIIFAIMAGGALFGFFGILVALPAAALIKVLLRFFKQQYHASH
jgi:predicted PurR-regulated permease PerM